MIHPRVALAIVLLALAQTPASAQPTGGGITAECIACHGEDGIAKDKDVPHLAGQNIDYLIKQMHDFQKGRRQHREMRVMSRTLSDAEIIAIARYYAELPR
jgi:cytochrome c553